MAFSAEQLATLETAAASGQLRVQVGDMVIQYQNLAELMQVIRMARADVAGASSSFAVSPFRARQAVFND